LCNDDDNNVIVLLMMSPSSLSASTDKHAALKDQLGPRQQTSATILSKHPTAASRSCNSIKRPYVDRRLRLTARNGLGLFHLLLHALEHLERVEYFHELCNEPLSLDLLVPLYTNAYTQLPRNCV